MFRNLIFDGISLKTYGLYISGDAVYDSPERDVEMISIPGRNGTFALDKGRFNNIEVTYPAGVFSDSQTNFADKVSALRNQLASRTGYRRIEDEYHPDEYRMGVYKRGLEFDPVHYNEASEFEITFDCKPQRFLKSGEVSVAITSGNTLTNPTLFESKPLLMAKGYGMIDLNGQPITINNTVVGDTVLIQPFSGGSTKYGQYGNGLINTGDTITVAQGSKATYTVKFRDSVDLLGVIIGNLTGKPFTVTQTTNFASRTVVFEAVFNKVNYTAGTNESKSSNFTANVQFSEDGLDQSVNVTFAPGIDYTANTRRISIYAGGNTFPSIVQSVSKEVRCQQVTAYSTVSTLGNPTYIDLEIGEAYKMVNGEAVSLNNSVSIGSTLPTLAVGGNTITYPNTITSLEIVPRWWRV